MKDIPVLGSFSTDYEGTGEKPINFKIHGTLDAFQAATAAPGPVLHGFVREPESAFLHQESKQGKHRHSILYDRSSSARRASVKITWLGIAIYQQI